MSVRLEQNKLKEYVRQILITDERTRNDNDRLVCALYTMLLSERGACLQQLSFMSVMLNRKAYKLPSYESVTRCRRKLQEQDETLKSDDNVQAMREVMEQEYKEWAVAN